MSEEQLARIERRIAALEKRLTVLERQGAGPLEASELEAGEIEGEAKRGTAFAAVGESGTWLSLAGRSFLILGGAFLIRAVTEAGVMPTPVGILVGVLYAVVWLVLADRAGSRGRAGEATTLAALSALVGYPLAWEAAARFGVLPAPGAVALVVALSIALLVVAERRDLRFATWFGSLAALVALAALIVSTHALLVAGIGLLALGVATAWLGYGRRGWRGLRWPMALAADLAILLAIVLVTREGGPPPGYPDLSLAGVWVLAVALAASYLGLFTLRTLLRRQDIALFAALQGFVAAWIGFGGAARVARVAERGLSATGVAATLVAIATYAAAFTLLERGPELRRSFRFTTSLALLLLVWGTTLFAQGRALAIGWSLLAIVAAAISMRFGRSSLAVHAALLGLASGVVSGLLGALAAAFAGPPEALAELAPRALIPALLASVLAYALIWRGGETERWARRVAAILSAAVAIVCMAVFVVGGLAAPLGLASSAEALALARTSVLAIAAVVLALSRRFGPFAPLAGFPLAALVLAGGELAFGLVRVGRPASLFAGFALFGLALLAVARLGRRRLPGSGDPAAS